MTSTPLPDGVRGTAAYVEFRIDNNAGMVAQFIILPEMVSPTNHTIIPAQVVARSISDNSPQRTWRFGVPDEYKSQGVKQGKRDFSRGLDTAATVAAVEDYFSKSYTALDSVISSGTWTLQGSPLLVQVSDADAAEIQTSDVPRGLIERIGRLRDAHGYQALPTRKATS